MVAPKDWEKIAEESKEASNQDSSENALDDLSDILEQDFTDKEVAPKAATSTTAEVKQLQVALKLAEDKAAENWDKMLKAVADMENARRRAKRDVEDAHKYSLEKFSGELIPVIDGLEQALEACSQADSDALAQTHQGIELTLKLFMDVLAKFSIEQLNPVGEAFDPNLHEAMSMLETPEAESGTVIDVFQKGYRLNERIIRPARVVVAK